MEHSEEFAVDRKIAGMIFQRHFSGFRNLKDDLIQVAVIRIWQFRRGGQYFTYTGACKVARRAMIDFIRPHAKFLDDISLDSCENDLAYIDILTDKNSEYENLACENLNLLLDQHLGKMTDRNKNIINMYLNRRSYAEIARAVGSTKQNVGQHINRFRRAIKQDMDELGVA